MEEKTSRFSDFIKRINWNDICDSIKSQISYGIEVSKEVPVNIENQTIQPTGYDEKVQREV